MTQATKGKNRGPRRIRRVFIWMVLNSVIALVAAEAVKADPPPDHYGQMTVEGVWATPAKAGGRSFLRFRILNDSHDHAHLLGIETPVATQSRIVARISDHETTTIDSVGVRSDSKLDLTTSHMWIELGPLGRDVKPGESIPIELIFLRSRLHVEAHVHDADG